MLELSVEDTLLPRVAFLRDAVGVAEENLGKVILRLPSVLTYSEESMQQRIEFLLEAGLCQDDLAKAVTSHPQVPLLSATVPSHLCQSYPLVLLQRSRPGHYACKTLLSQGSASCPAINYQLCFGTRVLRRLDNLSM